MVFVVDNQGNTEGEPLEEAFAGEETPAEITQEDQNAFPEDEVMEDIQESAPSEPYQSEDVPPVEFEPRVPRPYAGKGVGKSEGES